jgi:(R,R)-butanediol dehydrogenase/meso-butanediol dehydrogenase/diacetyl reductase
MRAAVLEGPGKLVVQDVPEPEPRDGDALVQVLACGLCGSDLTLLKGGYPSGAILGHEGAGRVLTAPAGSGLSEGDLVALRPMAWCGGCVYCTSGRGELCPEGVANGLVFSRPGAFAERIAVPAAWCSPVGEIDPVDATFADPLAVSLHAVSRGGRWVVPAAVVGLGAIGLATLMAARLEGLGPIAGIDPVETKRERAVTAGAVAAFAPGQDAGLAGSLGGPPEIVFECTGRAEALQEAVGLAAAGGVVVIVGIAPEARILPIVLVPKQVDLVPTFCYRPDEWDRAIMFLREGRASVREHVDARVPLEALPDAAVEFMEGRLAKVVAEP